MLGFLSVSTELPDDLSSFDVVFQSRAGFSECLDPTGNIYRLDVKIAPLARIEEYADRDALFADLTPDTTQL